MRKILVSLYYVSTCNLYLYIPINKSISASILEQWRRVDQNFAGAEGNNEFESQAQSAVIEGAKHRSKLWGSE